MEREEKRETLRDNLRQILRFLVIGASNMLVDLLVFELLSRVFGWFYAAKVIGYLCGMVNSYIWNGRWTFRGKSSRNGSEMLRFVAVNLTGMLASLLGIGFCRNVIGITNEAAEAVLPLWLGKILRGDTICNLVASVFSLAVNYVGSRFFVFVKGKEEE